MKKIFMHDKTIRLIVLSTTLLFMLCLPNSSYAQCNNDNNTACGSVNGFYFRANIVPTKFEWNSVNFSAGTPEYFTFTAVAGVTYEFRTCSDQNMELTIAHQNGSALRQYDSNTYECAGNGNNEYALYTANTSGVHRVVVSRHGSCADLNTTGTLEYKEKLTRNDFIGENYISHTARDNFWIGNIKNLPSGNVPSYDVLFPSNRDDITNFCVEPLNFDRNFGGKGPGGCGIGNNRFAINYSINKYFIPGRYRITVGGDDGFIFGTKFNDIVLGENILINEWRTGSYRTRTVEVDLYGFVALRLYYFENNGDARVSFNIQKISSTPIIYGDELLCGIGATSQMTGKSASDTWSFDNSGITISPSGLVTSTATYLDNNSNSYLPRVIINRGSTRVGARRLVTTTNENHTVRLYNGSSCITSNFLTVNTSTQNGALSLPFIWCRDDFSSTSPQIGVNTREESAVVNNGSLQLTAAVNSQTGTLIVPNPGGFNSRILTASFNMYMGEGSSADGMVVSYGNVGIYFDSYNNFNGKSTTSETGTTCEPRKFEGQGVSIKIVNPNDHNQVYQCLSTYGYDLRNSWNNVMIYINNGQLSVIINGNYVIEKVYVNTLEGDRTGWNWVFKGITGSFNDVHRIDDLSIVSYNDFNSVLEYSYDSTNGLDGNWISSNVANGDASFTNVPSGTYNVRVRSKFDLNRTPCFTPHIIRSVDVNDEYNVKAVNNGLWTNPLTWSGNNRPKYSSCVIIPNGVTVIVPPHSTNYAANLKVENGGKLILSSNAKLLVRDGFINENTDNNSVVFESGSEFIQINNVDNSGNVTVKRTTTPMDKYGYTYWGSPVTGQGTLLPTPLFPGANASYRWDTSVGGSDPDGLVGWVAHNGLMQPTSGYIMRAPQNIAPWNSQIGGLWQKAPVTAEFVGIPNNGFYRINVVACPEGLIPHENAKMTYMSNPYPSSIHIDKLLNDHGMNSNPSIVPTVYFWTHATTPVLASNGAYTYPTGDFASYTLLGGIAAVNDPSNVRPMGFVAPGQGFFVQGTPTAGRVTFNNSYRYFSFSNVNGVFSPLPYDSQGQFFRVNESDNFNEQNLDSILIEKHRMWFDLKGPDHRFKQILVGYSNLATDGVDGLDGLLHSASLPFQLYTKVGEEKFGIQSLALPFNHDDVIPLGLKIDQAGNYSIKLSDFDGLFIEESVYLKDNYNGSVTSIKDGSYEFHTETGIFEDRFEVIFTKPLNTEDVSSNLNWVAFKNGDGLQIRSYGFNMKEIYIYDVLGRSIYKNTLNDDNHYVHRSMANQVLLLRIVTQEGVVLTKKVQF